MLLLLPAFSTAQEPVFCHCPRNYPYTASNPLQYYSFFNVIDLHVIYHYRKTLTYSSLEGFG